MVPSSVARSLLGLFSPSVAQLEFVPTQVTSRIEAIRITLTVFFVRSFVTHSEAGDHLC